MTNNSNKDVILSSAGVTASLVLAEPTIFLSGFSRHEHAECPPALVRGSLVLRITKPIKIKAINLTFKGTSRTEWPEGIPGEKNETYEVNEVFSHEWRFFSTQFSNAEKSSGAHVVSALDGNDSEHSYIPGSNNQSNSLQPTSTTPHALINQHEAVSKGYRVFNPAEYVYNFELMLPQKLPETLKCNFGQLRWGFHLSIERHGTFKPRLTAHKDVTLLRTLGPSNLESSEPIVINRDWEDLLHYEIVIAGKAFAIGQSFNVAFALVPLAKVKCHRIRIYITEHTEYFCRNHRIHRVEPSHKFLLLEKKSPDGNRGDLLQTVQPGLSGLTELEFQVEIPESFPSRRDYLRPNANTECIKVYHWIKAVMRLSREDIRHNGEPKCYEVSIDSPITLVDPRTLQVNDLPDYRTAKVGNEITTALKPYQEFIQKGVSLGGAEIGLPGAPKLISTPSSSSSSSNSNMQAIGSTPEPEGRAILFTRQPSIAPPPFDADVRPPDLLPPDYNLSSENAKSYERRYGEYLRALHESNDASDSSSNNNANVTTETHEVTTPASGSTEDDRDSQEGVSTTIADNSSDSNASTISPVSDAASGSTGHTQYEASELTVPAGTASKDGSNKTDDASPHSSPKQSGEDTPTRTSPSSPSSRPKHESWADRAKKELRADQDSHMPVFSEIIWSEEVSEDQNLEDIDPQYKFGNPKEPMNLNPVEGVSPGNTSPVHISPSNTDTSLHSAVLQSEALQSVASKAEVSKPPKSPATTDSGFSTPPTSIGSSSSSSAAPTSPFSPPRSMPRVSRIPSNPPNTTPRAIPKRGSLTGQKSNPFTPSASSHVQRLRASGIGTVNTSAGSGGATSPNLNSMMARRSSLHNQPRMSLKSPTALSMSAGSPLTSQWGEQREGDRTSSTGSVSVGIPIGSVGSSSGFIRDRRDSAGSTASSAPRYFRQSSVISVDISRQADFPRRESRRPSHVSEIQELRDWDPISRTNSEASFAVSIAEYQSLQNDRPQANAPLLGDEESEMDIGLEWEHDFEDYDMESDRGSIVSAFYTVLTP